MASAADGKVVIDTQLNNKGFTKGITGLKSQMGGLTSVVRKLGGVIASAFAVKALINFGKECVELGSNVSEVQNVVDTAFGDMSYKVEAFAETAIQNFGMSALAAKKTASNYMAMAKGMGLADEAASDMAISLAGLTGDVASFYNISQEAADTKLKSVFTGESESLKELGVVMTQTNLKAYALEQGITKDLSAMSQAELVALRYGYVMKSLALANGDFAKTSDSWANQTRILSMQWEEFMSIIGQALITVLTPCVKVLNQIVTSLIQMANSVNTLVTQLFGGQQQTTAAVTDNISESVENQDDLTESTEETAEAQKKLLAGFDEINTLGGDSETETEAAVDTGIDVAGVSALATTVEGMENSGLLDFFNQLAAAVEPFRASFMTALEDIKAACAIAWEDILSGASWITTTFTQIWTDLSSLASPLLSWFTEDFLAYVEQYILTVGNIFGGLLDTVGMVFSDLWNIVIFPCLQQWIVDILPMLTQFAEQFLITFDVLFNEVKTIFDRIWQEAIAPALELIQGIWEDAWNSILDAWEKYGVPIFEKVREAIQNTSDYLQNIWETIILPVWQTIMSVVDELWTNHLKPLWDNILDFIGMLAEGALDIYNKFILRIANWFVDKFGGTISKTISDMVERFGNFLGTVSDIASYIIDALKGVINFLVGTFTGDWKRAFEGVKQIFKGIVNGLIVMVESFCNYFVRAINKVISAANTLSFDIPDWVPFVGGETWGLNIPKISEIRLPRLATGAVVPPNREFMAVLGDNKTETEVVSPLSTMKQAMIEALRESGGNSGTYTFVVNLDGKEVARNQVKHINDMTRQAGKPVLLF